MRRFTIDSTVLGTPRHIVGDSEGYFWSESVPKDSWHLTGDYKASATSRCLDTLMRLSGRNVPNVPDRYLTSFSTLITGSHSASIPWHMALPQDQFKLFFKNVVQVTTDSFSDLPFDYYEVAWAAGSRVLGALRPAAINIEEFNRIVADSPGTPGLESFRPKRSGFSRPVEYDRFSTRTGRLTVSDGPNFLILKKDNRRIIKSSYDDGQVVSLDFKALEARIVLAESGRYSDASDIYDDISVTQFKGVLPRDVVKTAVLAELYGISRASLRIRLGVTDQKLDEFIRVIKEYFGVESLRLRLKEQVGSSGKIVNRFGRPLNIPEGQDNLLINTYAQSSGVDVSLLGFDNVLIRLGTDGIRPLFVLHDAIILDVRGDRIEDVKSINDVEIPTYDRPFPLKFEHLVTP